MGCFSSFLSYSSTRAWIDNFIPVDVYVPGCPPRPEGVVESLMKIQNLIDKEKLSDYALSSSK